MKKLISKIGAIPHLFGKIVVLWCIGFGTAASVYALRILRRTGHDSAAVLGVILAFFGGELMGAAKYKKEVITYKTKRKVNRNTNRNTVNFQQAQKDIKQRKGYLHKCCVCGVTDADDGNMEFRYCSKCIGYHCYCMNHINSHEHVL